jgi:hypothetical protein
MAAATVDKEIARLDGNLIAFAMKAATKIFKGILVNVVTATGLAEPGSATAGQAFVGVSYEQADNSAGAASARDVRCYRKGVFTFPYTGTAPVIGDVLYVSDDSTVTATAPVAPVKCGVAVRVGSGIVDVDIDRRVA